MTVTDELVKELRHIHRDGTWSAKQPDTPHPLCTKAADRIEALTAENERLRHDLERQMTITKQEELAVLADRDLARGFAHQLCPRPSEFPGRNGIEYMAGEITRHRHRHSQTQSDALKIAREALQFYAETKNWAYVKSAGCNCVDADGGDTARAALKSRGLEIREKGQ